jgi:alpha,alpha-trehalose phosphorylase
VLAMFLRGEHIDVETKRRNFDYYDPITTGDSSLSACVQAIVAAEVGYADLAWDYFNQSLYLDLADSHGNTADGVHIANAGGVWVALVNGFAGFRDTGTELRFEPRLPKAWNSMRFHLERHGSQLEVVVDADGATVTVLAGSPVPVRLGDQVRTVGVDEQLRIPA